MGTEEQTAHVEMARWGKDHWSTLAYIETRIVDYSGEPDRRHMRCDVDRHPGLGHHVEGAYDGEKYPTKLWNWVELHDHDDWDCLEDAEAEGLLENVGSGMFPVFALSELGKKVCAALRAHKQNGGNFGEFVYEVSR